MKGGTVGATAMRMTDVSICRPLRPVRAVCFDSSSCDNQRSIFFVERKIYNNVAIDKWLHRWYMSASLLHFFPQIS
jgi:hypothetical protein